MTTALTTKPAGNAPASKPSALKLMAARLQVEPEKLLATLKATVFAKASDEEVMALTVVANEYDLNPFLKEIYAFPAKGGGIVPIVSVDGWNKMLIRQPDFDGIKFMFENAEDGKPVSCTATIYVKNRTHPVEITEYFDECKRNTEPWNNMPRRMLRNRTLCQASRVAFGFSGVHNDDEAASIIDITPMPSELPPKMVTIPTPETKVTPQQELEAFVLGAAFDFTALQTWGKETGNITNADSIATFAEISTDDAKRLLKAKTGLINSLKQLKPGNE